MYANKGLKMNVGKSKVMVLEGGREDHFMKSLWMIGSWGMFSEFKYLGFVLDESKHKGRRLLQ